jgi:hypothetical protein
MDHHTEGHSLESDLRVTAEGRIIRAEEAVANPDLETHTPYEVKDEHLKEWINFLQHCGGFQVW